MNWSAELQFAPIKTPEGKILRTLADARAYLLEHPNEIAAGEVLKAAQKPNQFTLHCARQAVSRAVHGDVRSERQRRETWRDRRKNRAAR